MTCVEVESLLGASLDGELDVMTGLVVDKHLSACATCSAMLDRLERLREEIVGAEVDWSAAADLRPLAARILRQYQRPWWKRAWLGPSLAAAAAAALCVTLFLGVRAPSQPLERQIVDSHIRSLLEHHLIDVPSSDRHTVKPWFQGKLNFAPPVSDLTAEGFELIGGRLDVIAGHPAAAIVYKRRNHVINLWISSVEGSNRSTELGSVDGFQTVHWQHDGMLYWVVSDLNAAELRNFAEVIRRR